MDTREWASFALGALFNIVKGKRLTKAEMKSGETPFIGSSALNNGCTAMIGNDKNQHPENTITVCYNGSVGETFYQNKPYIASDDMITSTSGRKRRWKQIKSIFPWTKPASLTGRIWRSI